MFEGRANLTVLSDKECVKAFPYPDSYRDYREC